MLPVLSIQSSEISTSWYEIFYEVNTMLPKAQNYFRENFASKQNLLN